MKVQGAQIFNFRLLAVCLLLFFFHIVYCPSSVSVQNSAADVFEIIKVRERSARELLAQVQTVLSPTGRASVDTVSNAIIVSDTTDHVQQVRQLIKRLDIPVPLVNIRLRYHQATTRSHSLSTAGGISGGQGGLHMSSGSFSQDKNLQLTVNSGSSGYLKIGRDIPFTSFWLDLCYRYGYGFGWLTEYKRVESGFEVLPVVIGSRVDLTLVPRLAFADRKTIRFAEAATRMTVPVDTWMPVAASDFGMNTVSAAILTANGQTNSRAMVLEVKVTVR